MGGFYQGVPYLLTLTCCVCPSNLTQEQQRAKVVASPTYRTGKTSRPPVLCLEPVLYEIGYDEGQGRKAVDAALVAPVRSAQHAGDDRVLE